MFIFLLFVVSFAEKSYVKKIDDFRYYKIRTGDCNFVNANGTDHWFIVDRVVGQLKVTSYEKAECRGKSTSNKETEQQFSQYIGKFEEEPEHIAFYTVIDRNNCTNDVYALKIFYRKDCAYDNQTSTRYEVRNDNKFYVQHFSDKFCKTKKGNGTIVFNCNTCKNITSTEFVRYGCGAFSTMIFSIFILLVFLF